MKIILFRHGERIGDKLTSLGKKHVKISAQQLKNFNIKYIFSSPMNRCIETANIIKKTLNFNNFEVRNELTERWQLGHTPNTEEENIWWENYMNCDPPHSVVGENCHEFIERNYKIFNEIKTRFSSEDDILIVAHTATAYALVSYLDNKKPGTINWLQIGNANYLAIEI